MPPLKNLRHEQFVQLYFTDPEKNPTRAVIEAGFNVKGPKDKSTSASVTANRLLKDSKVQKRLQELLERQQRRLDITADRVLTEMARIGFSDARRIVGRDGCIMEPSQWDDEVAGSVAGFKSEKLFEGKGPDKKHVGYTQEIKLWDKNTALANLAKHLRLMGTSDNENGTVNNTQYNFYMPMNARDPEETLTHVPSSNGHANGSGNGST